MMHAEWFSGVRSCGALQSKSRMKSSAKSNVKDVGSELDLLKCTMVANTRSKKTKPKRNKRGKQTEKNHDQLSSPHLTRVPSPTETLKPKLGPRRPRTLVINLQPSSK